MTTPAKDKRFINFKLAMITDTITDSPKNALSGIVAVAITEFANKSCRRTAKDALVQALYAAARGGYDRLPGDVQEIVDRDDVQSFVRSIDDCFISTDGTGSEFHTEALDMLSTCGGVTLDDEDQEALIQWDALQGAAKFFGRRILDFEGLREDATAGEPYENSKVIATVPADYFFEVKGSKHGLEDMRLFRTVCAVRSLVGKKRFTRTTKNMLRARMVGCASWPQAEKMAESYPAVAAELEALQSRKRFDRIITEGAARGFYHKHGVGRYLYVSTVASSKQDLLDKVKVYRARHQAYNELGRAT